MTACIQYREELHDFTDHPGIITDSVVEYLPLEIYETKYCVSVPLTTNASNQDCKRQYLLDLNKMS